MNAGGEGGIRTPDRGVSPYNGLANRRLQPLGHLSVNKHRKKHLRDAKLIELPRTKRFGISPAGSYARIAAQLQPLGHLSRVFAAAGIVSVDWYLR
jgi:hypothetical protein